jgi:mRNA interferase YafQ
LRRLTSKNAAAAEHVRIALALLANDAFDPKLKPHKLAGRLNDVWAASAGYDLRILFEFQKIEGAEAILLHTVGSHDDVY